MFEVYAGMKPGRRNLAAILSAVALVATLGIAWLQVAESRVLGPETSVPGTPLRVRVPRDWARDRNDPGAFIKPVRGAPVGRGPFEIEPRIKFSYDRRATFIPPEELFEGMRGVTRPEPARIGPFPAVQVRRLFERQWGPLKTTVESVVRVASLPGGQLISVVYLPTSGLTTADLDLFDRICAAVRIEDETVSATAVRALALAGVEFQVEDGWQVGLPQWPEIPGVYVSGAVRGIPSWGLGIFRTWLAKGRTPGDLLIDFAAMNWLVDKEKLQLRKSERADGLSICAVGHPNPAKNEHPVTSAWVISKSATEVVMIFTYTNRLHLAEGDSKAQQVAQQIAIKPIEAFTSLESAEKAGSELAAMIGQKGARPWWGRERARLQYLKTTPVLALDRTVRRSAEGRDADRGYRATVEQTVNGRRWPESSWSLDAHAAAYLLDTREFLDSGSVAHIQEQRSSAARTAQRTITIDNAERWTYTFELGSAFVCPPMEPVAAGWVSGKSEGAWVIQVATRLGPGTHSRFLKSLPPTDGRPRALLLEDYQPVGAILGFDEDGEVRYQIEPGMRMERLP